MEKSIEGQNFNLKLDKYIREQFQIPDVDVRTYSPLTLAFIGDGLL